MERQISAYLIAMPSREAAHIQNTAPGPPSAMAWAVPMMLPVPTVEARAVAAA